MTHHRPAPAEGLAVAHRDENAEDQRHHHLRHTAAEIAPAGRGRVGRAHAVRREHHRRVVLRDDERGADGADAETEQQEALVTRG